MIAVGLRRARALRRVERGSPLGRVLAAEAPPSGTPIDEVPLLAVDLETTGLDPRRDHILSIGFVPVEGGEIVLAGAREVLVRAGRDVGQSAVFHGLTDDVVAAGVPPTEALDLLLDALVGRTLVAHHSPLEEGFLDHACRAAHGVPLPQRSIDTLDLQRRVLSRRPGDIPDGGVRLGAARAHFGLPTYRSHAALTDALGCAELFLAQRAELATRGARTLGHYLR